MQHLITVALRNFELTTVMLGLLAAIISIARQPATDRHPWEEILAFFLLFGVGFGFLYSGAMHIFFGPMVAQFIGWANSPFQAEVGFASLGFGVVGILAFRGGFGLRLAAVVGPAVFALGAAGVHIVQMITAGNFAPGNAGAAFFSDLIGPVLGLALLWLRYGAHSACQRDTG